MARRNIFNSGADAIPLESVTAEACAVAFWDGWCHHHGVLTELITDHGAQFTSQLWTEMGALLGIKWILVNWQGYTRQISAWLLFRRTIFSKSYLL